MTRLRTNSGQATVLTVLFLTVIVAMLAAVLDVGAWFRADRKLQGHSRCRGARGRPGAA